MENMNEKIATLKKTARMAGLLYLIMAITGAFGNMYVPTQLIVMGNLSSTATNIINNEFLFRAGILCNMICQTVFVFLVLALYQLFQNVSKYLTKTMFALVIVSVPIAFFILFNQLFALTLLKEHFMTGFEPSQQQALAMVFLKMFDNGNYVIGIFWGLWLIPFGQLVYKSGFIPKIFGIFLLIGGISYVIDAIIFVLFPEFHSVTTIIVGISSSIAELAILFWLLIKGVRFSTDAQLSND
ncbi:MAG: DUF4386 domain-containing protein [Bacteroidales bacterium]